jgi:tetratricopeptide (TPR) repeat protein
MKQLTLLVCVLVPALGALWAVPDQPPQSEWDKVNDAISKQLPQTAIEALEPIITAALQAGRHAEAAKAIALKITMEGTIQGDKPEERITRLEAVMGDLPVEIRPTMEVILAHWYWQYFQENRWRFMQRTQLGEPSGPDLLTWDLARILAEIDRHFTAALGHAELLQRTPVGEFDDLLIKGTVPDSHRPTMFDFIAHEALTFYGSGEQAGTAPQDAFVLSADSPIFAPLDEFLAWKPESLDADSPILKAIELYQKLLAFHRDDPESVALADADLGRLTFGFNQAVGEEKNARYKAALERFTQRWSSQPIAARAWEAWGRVLQSDGELVDAHQLAQRGFKTFPESPGGKLCYNLLQDIEAREIQVTVEQVWNQPWPAIQVQYRNVTRVHFRAVALDWHASIRGENFFPGRMDHETVQQWLAKRPF